MNIEDAKASLEQAITGHTAKHWSYTPAVRALLNYIAELESRTVTVKLPPRVDSSNVPFTAHTWNCCLDAVEKCLAAAGIQVIEGDSQDGN